MTGPISFSYFLYNFGKIVGMSKQDRILFSSVHPTPACRVPNQENNFFIYNEIIILVFFMKIMMMTL